MVGRISEKFKIGLGNFEFFLTILVNDDGNSPFRVHPSYLLNKRVIDSVMNHPIFYGNVSILLWLHN